jgi:predicted transcriptional regulator
MEFNQTEMEKIGFKLINMGFVERKGNKVKITSNGKRALALLKRWE